MQQGRTQEPTCSHVEYIIQEGAQGEVGVKAYDWQAGLQYQNKCINLKHINRQGLRRALASEQPENIKVTATTNHSGHLQITIQVCVMYLPSCTEALLLKCMGPIPEFLVLGRSLTALKATPRPAPLLLAQALQVVFPTDQLLPLVELALPYGRYCIQLQFLACKQSDELVLFYQQGESQIQKHHVFQSLGRHYQPYKLQLDYHVREEWERGIRFNVGNACMYGYRFRNVILAARLTP